MENELELGMELEETFSARKKENERWGDEKVFWIITCNSCQASRLVDKYDDAQCFQCNSGRTLALCITRRRLQSLPHETLEQLRNICAELTEITA